MQRLNKRGLKPNKKDWLQRRPSKRQSKNVSKPWMRSKWPNKSASKPWTPSKRLNKNALRRWTPSKRPKNRGLKLKKRNKLQNFLLPKLYSRLK